MYVNILVLPYFSFLEEFRVELAPRVQDHNLLDSADMEATIIIMV